MDLIAQIETGAYDADLGKIKLAIEKRMEQVRASRTIDDYHIGDRVVFNEKTATRYMVGQFATVSGKRQKKILVRLENPMGRFSRETATGSVSADIVVPLAIVDLV